MGFLRAAGRRPGKKKKTPLIQPCAGRHLTIKTAFIKMLVWAASVLAAWVVGGQEQEQGFLLQATWSKITP